MYDISDFYGKPGVNIFKNKYTNKQMNFCINSIFEREKTLIISSKWIPWLSYYDEAPSITVESYVNLKLTSLVGMQ